MVTSITVLKSHFRALVSWIISWLASLDSGGESESDEALVQPQSEGRLEVFVSVSPPPFKHMMYMEGIGCGQRTSAGNGLKAI